MQAFCKPNLPATKQNTDEQAHNLMSEAYQDYA